MADHPAIVPGEIRSCPFCHTRVVVRADFACPACQNDMRGVADDGRRRLAVADGVILPLVCMHCGDAAEGMQRLDAARAVDDGGASWFERVLVTLFGAAHGHRLRVAKQARVELAIDLPVCTSCWTRSLPRPQHVNFDRRTITVLVHHRLDDAVTSALAEVRRG